MATSPYANAIKRRLQGKSVEMAGRMRDTVAQKQSSTYKGYGSRMPRPMTAQHRKMIGRFGAMNPGSSTGSDGTRTTSPVGGGNMQQAILRRLKKSSGNM